MLLYFIKTIFLIGKNYQDKKKKYWFLYLNRLMELKRFVFFSKYESSEKLCWLKNISWNNIF